MKGENFVSHETRRKQGQGEGEEGGGVLALFSRRVAALKAENTKVPDIMYVQSVLLPNLHPSPTYKRLSTSLDHFLPNKQQSCHSSANMFTGIGECNLTRTKANLPADSD